MSISVSRNPDGSISVSCGTESVVIPATGSAGPPPPTGPGGPIVLYPPTPGGGGVTAFRLKTIHPVEIGPDKNVMKALAGLSVAPGDVILVTVGAAGADIGAIREAVDRLGVAVTVGVTFRDDGHE